jgi:hypothetical protein
MIENSDIKSVKKLLFVPPEFIPYQENVWNSCRVAVAQRVSGGRVHHGFRRGVSIPGSRRLCALKTRPERQLTAMGVWRTGDTSAMLEGNAQARNPLAGFSAGDRLRQDAGGDLRNQVAEARQRGVKGDARLLST